MKRVSPITKCSIRKQFDERTVSIEREREREREREVNRERRNSWPRQSFTTSFLL